MVKHKTEHLLLLSRVFDIPKGVTNYVEYHEKPEDLTIFKKRDMDHLLHHAAEKILNIFSKSFPEKFFSAKRANI
jgi:hypothetical protein